MNRRKFLAVSSVTLGSACTSEVATVAVDKEGGSIAEGRYHLPATQTSPLGHKVIQDRPGYIQQYKYENWEVDQDWNDDKQLWWRSIYRWGQGLLPIQRRPMQVFPDLYLLGLDDCSQGIYLWDTGDGLLLIDPSYSRYQQGIETQIRQLGWSEKDVKWVLLTHMHWDHTQGAAQWEKRGASIHIHPDDEGYVTGTLDPEGPDPIEQVREPQFFTDEQILRFGRLELTAIHTPGHTPGATCFSTEWKGRGVLISGDIALHWGRHAWMGASYCDWDQYLASLWKLYDHADAAKLQTMLPGHGTIDLEGAVDSLYAVIQIVSEVIRRRRAGEKLDGLNAYHFLWQLKHNKVSEPAVLRS